MSNATKDDNAVPVILWVNSVDWVTPLPVLVDPSNWALLAEI